MRQGIKGDDGAAGGEKLFQQGDGGAQQGAHARREDDELIGRATHDKRLAFQAGAGGHDLLVAEVKVVVGGQHGAGKIVEALAVLIHGAGGWRALAEHGPTGGHGVQDEHIAHGFTLAEHGPDAREVIFHHGVVFPPGGVVVEGRRVIALAAAAQGIEGEVLAAQVDAEHNLPITDPFLALRR